MLNVKQNAKPSKSWNGWKKEQMKSTTMSWWVWWKGIIQLKLLLNCLKCGWRSIERMERSTVKQEMAPNIPFP